MASSLSGKELASSSTCGPCITMRKSGRTRRCLTLVRMSQVNRLSIPHSLCISVFSPPCVLSFLCLSLSLCVSTGRFLNEEGTGLCIPSPSYLPFGAGVRVCLGEALAKMEIFLFLSWILQRLTMTVSPGQPLPSLEGKFGVVLQPVKYKVNATPRAGWEKSHLQTS